MMAFFCVIFLYFVFQLLCVSEHTERRVHLTASRHCTFAVCTALTVALLYGDDVTNAVTVNAQFSWTLSFFFWCVTFIWLPTFFFKATVTFGA